MQFLVLTQHVLSTESLCNHYSHFATISRGSCSLQFALQVVIRRGQQDACELQHMPGSLMIWPRVSEYMTKPRVRLSI
jgi:hypothetical protein